MRINLRATPAMVNLRVNPLGSRAQGMKLSLLFPPSSSKSKSTSERTPFYDFLRPPPPRALPGGCASFRLKQLRGHIPIGRQAGRQTHKQESTLTSHRPGTKQASKQENRQGRQAGQHAGRQQASRRAEEEDLQTNKQANKPARRQAPGRRKKSRQAVTQEGKLPDMVSGGEL